MNTSSNIVIFKNDRIGDLMTSVSAINLIIEENKDKKITIFLSKINYKMKFLFNEKNVEIIVLNYKLSLINRIRILFFFLKRKISKVYIIRPRNFFFLLPLIFYFKKTKFYGLCLNGTNNYKRPVNFLRRFLTKFVINDRGTQSKRLSREELQLNLVSENWKKSYVTKDYNFELSSILKKILPNNYCLIHYKKLIFEELSWGIDGMDKIINDIEGGNDNIIFKKKYNWYDFKEKKSGNNNSKILYLENIDGLDMFNVIKLSKKIIASHGTITLLANLTKVPVLDLFYCEIKNRDDYHRNKNSFHEHKPNNSSYNFIIPNKNINKTIRKIQFSLKNEK